ncbi:MAG: hypothetical protein EAZ07_07295 [Cytophagales bacterium]|nr:MAG: hypothetical protein EAZ07_07295 [Cytophagales bacterium]
MVEYNPRDWFSLIFKFHKGDTLNILWPGMITVAIYTATIVYIERNVFNIVNSAVIHSLLAFVISLLLVFRTNTAYERWWEGQKLWTQLSASIRNISFKLNGLLPSEMESDKEKFFLLISNYPYSIINQLQKNTLIKHYKISEKYPLTTFTNTEHAPNKILTILYEEIVQLRKIDVIDSTQMRLLDIDIAQLNLISNNCERIKSTPIPYSYSMFLKKFLFAYILTLPFGFGEQLGYYLAPIVSFVFYVLLSLELIAASIEDPFGNDTEDLPLLDMSNKIRQEAAEIMSVGCGC